MYTHTATRLRSNHAYRISEKQRNDRANLRFKDDISENKWVRDGTAGKDFHRKNAKPKTRR